VAYSRRSSRSRFTLLLLVLTSITVITLDFRGDGDGLIAGVRETALDAMAPLQSAAEAVFSPVGDAFGGITGYGRVQEENARLRERLAELETAELEMEDARQERRQLLALQDLRFAGDVPQVAARVVSAPSSNFELTVEIDRGRAHGLARNMPVVSGAGLVGRIVRVSENRAVVLLISDPTFAVGVRLARSGETGIAEGAGRNRPLTVDFVDARTEVRDREAVVTSGVETSIFPPSIPVGRVSATRTTGGILTQEVEVEPVAELDKLQFVKVLQWTPPPPEEPIEEDPPPPPPGPSSP
jgi:rod shape-determining protein MreC